MRQAEALGNLRSFGPHVLSHAAALETALRAVTVGVSLRMRLEWVAARERCAKAAEP